MEPTNHESDPETMTDCAFEPVECETCGTETEIDAEAARLGGVTRCPICESDIDLDAALGEEAER